MTISVDKIEIADPPSAWADAGFTVDTDDVCRIGNVRIRLSGGSDGITGWSLRGLAADASLDGIPTTRSESATSDPAEHPNGVTGIDHVVLLSPDLARTTEAMTAIGVDPRRERDAELGGQAIRQVFFRFGEVIVEVVGTPDTASKGPSTLWGITYNVADLDATAAFFGDRTTPVKAAVQPGRRITTLHHRELGMSVRTAMMSAPILGE